MGLYDDFQNPGAEFRQAPFWFWNHRLDRETLDWQIEQMHEKGLGGFVMHARHGLITPYLSDEWFECIRFGCEKASELGMIPWAYDERDWPSGPAGGEVIADPANRLSYLRLDTADVEEHAALDATADDVVAAYAAPSGESLQRLKAGEAGSRQGRWRVAKAVQIECPAILWFESYLNTLDSRACAEFIRSTYDLHEQKLGDLKKLGLAGFFTDEPAFSTYPDDLRRIPWCDELPVAFQEAKGYDLLDRLPDLFGEGGDGAQVRVDYWDVATTLMENAFFKAIGDWCDTRGLQLIGHPLGEEPLFYQFRCLGNIFQHLKHFHMPGMDHLGVQVGKGTPGGMAPKMIASAALLAGRDRTMTEVFGESGWGLSLKQMKWMADWHIVHGINYIIPHAFYYSVAGRRKKDSPPSEFYQAPFWPYYRRFADYTARLTAAMTGGRHGAKVAVLYPMSSIWADFVPGESAPDAVAAMEQAFSPLGETLLSIHRDFVVLDEQSFATAEVDGSSFTVNGLTFEALVIPKLTSIREDALDALRRVAESCVAASAPNDTLRVLRSSATEPGDTIELSDIPGVTVMPGSSPDDLAAALKPVIPEVAIEGAPDLYYLHRRKEDDEGALALYFFANTALEALKTTVSLETTGLAEIWDPETAERYSAPGQAIVDGRLQIPLSFAPMGSRLIVVRPDEAVSETPVPETRPVQRIKLCEDLWYFAPENGSIYALKQWDMDIETRHSVTEIRYATQFMMPENLGNLRLILDGVPEFPDNVPEATRDMMAHQTQAAVLLDGKPLTEELPWEIDQNFRVLDMRNRCQPGTHRIEIVIKSSGWFPQPALGEYVWLAGDFLLDTSGGAAGVPTLIPIRGIQTGPWEEQGHPFFSGTASYYMDYEFSDDIAGKRVFLDAGNVSDILELEVNTASAGVRTWAPYRIEVTEYVHSGYNQFSLKITNSSRSFFEGPDKNTPSGLLEDVWLEIEDA